MVFGIPPDIIIFSCGIVMVVASFLEEVSCPL